MNTLYDTYAAGSKSLTLERARTIDLKQNLHHTFNPLAYKQGILFEGAVNPVYRTSEPSLSEESIIVQTD